MCGEIIKCIVSVASILVGCLISLISLVSLYLCNASGYIPNYAKVTQHSTYYIVQLTGGIILLSIGVALRE